MAISIVDTAPIVAAADRRDPNRTFAQSAFLATKDTLVIPAPVTAEVDYLLGDCLGRDAQVRFLASVAAGDFQVECLAPAEYQQVVTLCERYRAMRPGLADLAVVVLAARFDTRRIITLDQKHFRTLRPLQGGVFTLLPWDA